ncbi:MAG: hypothetical protein JNM00_14340 [Flavobacteriales bacterium]|nr:hypothetical protein [Flavobacteriales bacterium]
MRSIILSLLILVGAPQFCRSQQPLVDEYRIEDGLVSNTVYCVTQDRDGFIWIGTDAGVSRFDGITFTNFTIDDGLCDNEILRIQQDKEGRMWFLSLSGCLAYYLDGNIRSSREIAGLRRPSNTLGLTGMHEDSRGNIWFMGIDQQVGLLSGDSLRWLNVNPDISTSFNRGFAEVYEDASGEIFFFRSDGIFRWTGTDIVRDDRWPTKVLMRNCFVRPAPHEAYLMTSDGLYHMVDNQMNLVMDSTVYSQCGDVQGLFIANDSYWLADFNGGLCRYSMDGKMDVPERLFEDIWVNYLFADRDDNVWIATRERGVHCITRDRSLAQSFSLPGKVTAMACNPDGSALLANETGELYRYADGQCTNIYALPGASSILDIMLHDDDLYVRTFTGVYLLSGLHTKQPVLSANLSASIPKDMAVDREGNLYMVSLAGIERYPVGGKAEFISEIPSSRRYHICAGIDGRLWFEDHDKLLCYANGKVEEVTSFNRNSFGRISSIVEMPDGSIVVATLGNGIRLLNDKQVVTTLTTRDGLLSDVCSGIRLSGDTCWVVTPQGISWIVNLESRNPEVHNITATNGLPSGKIVDILPLGDRLLVAMYNGLIQLPRDAEEFNALPPMPVITGLFAGGTAVTATDIIPYGSNLSIRYSAPTFAFARMNQFEYRIDGKQWISTTSRFIEMSSPGAGTHVMELRAKRYNSAWSEPLVYAFTVHTPVWMRPWFIALVILLSAGALVLVVRAWIRRNYRQRLKQLESEQALLAERNRISGDLHDDLGAELSNIVILTRIAKSKLGLSQEEAAPIDRIDRAASDTINKMSGIIWSLNPGNDSLDNLADYIRRYTYDFLELHHLEGEVHIEGAMPDVQMKGMIRRNVFLIVKEALHNIHKHSGADRVTIRFVVENRMCCITITDNGSGLTPGAEQSGGIGLKSMRQRAQDIGGKWSITSGINGGCEIALCWPVDRNSEIGKA